MQQNPSYRDSLGNWYPYFFNSIGAFFLSDCHPLVYFIIFEMYGLPHQFAIAWENDAKLIEQGEPGKWIPIFPLSLGSFFSIRFPCYGILHHMWNPWVSQSIFHSMGKYSKIHRVGRAWEIGTHTFLIAYLLCLYQISILWYTSLHGKFMSFFINFI